MATYNEIWDNKVLFLYTCFCNAMSDWKTLKICDSIYNLVNSLMSYNYVTAWLYVACNAPIWGETAEVYKNGNNHIQNFNLWKSIAGSTLLNYVLRLGLRIAVKLNTRPYIQLYTSPNENFKYSYPLLKD